MSADIITTNITAPSGLPQLLAQTREHYILSLGQPIDELVTGAVVFEPFKTNRVLIVKRAPHEDYFPNFFEIPGGKVDAGEAIAAGLARELLDETGLVMTKVLTQLPGMAYTTTKTVVEGEKEVVIVKKSVQLNFAVEVAPGDIKLDENEHVEWMWAGLEELHEVEMSELMRECLVRILEGAGC